MKICIDSISCRAKIGIFDWEKQVLQPVLIDVQIETMNRRAAISDDIKDTISYKDLSKTLKIHVQSQHFGLIERMASECCQLVLDFDKSITMVQVQVSKPGALSSCKNVRVIEKMYRNQVVIGIGSNIDPKKNIATAKEFLKREFNVLAFARDLKTKAVARDGDPDFINTAVLINTAIDRNTLTRRLKHIEWEMGRQRQQDRYGNRLIDFDLLLWNQNLEDGDIPSRPFLQQSIEELLPGVLEHMKLN